MNNENEHHDLIESLDQLAKRDRSEPADGFEQRIREAINRPETAHRHQRPRKQKSTAWIPFATAAAVGVFAYLWFPSSPMPVPGADEQQVASMIEATPEESMAAELWLASYETMDELVAVSEEFDERLDWLDLQLEAAEADFDSEVQWQEIGASL